MLRFAIRRFTFGAFLSFDLMNRKRCFWFILAEW